MNVTKWKPQVARLPDNLCALEVAFALGISESHARMVIKGCGYRVRSRHGEANRRRWEGEFKKIDPREVDWTMQNADIARLFCVSREWVRRMRAKFLKENACARCGAALK